MSVNDDPRRYAVLAAPAAWLSQQESRPLRRRRVADVNRGLPAGGLPAAPSGSSGQEDTPVYWQTVQAMASSRWRPDG